jgi:hypothetical protein
LAADAAGGEGRRVVERVLAVAAERAGGAPLPPPLSLATAGQVTADAGGEDERVPLVW